MSHTDDDRIVTEVVRAGGTTPAAEDSPEATLVEPVRFSPAELAAATAAQASLSHDRRPAAPRSPRLPGWVLPYLIGCIILLSAGAVVLWAQARALGHF